MAETKITTPYSTAARLVKEVPSWLNEYDAQRLAAYQLYEDIYWTNPGTFKLTQRGSEENPIYLPSGRIIVNTMNRYVAKGWGWAPDPEFGSDTQKKEALLLIGDFFKRERFRSTFIAAKKYGMIRGDWAFYITGNPLKPEGKRLTLKSIDPAMVFPITDDEDVDRILGVDLIEQIVDDAGVSLIIKQRYLKSAHPEHPSGGVEGLSISYEKTTLELENWETDEAKTVRTDFPIAILEGITNLPVYHIKNGSPEPGNPFGISEMRGLERVMAGLNQSITDEELALALEGLGMYTSEKGQPRDASGNVVPWQLGPGRVVHDGTFKRVTGVTSVSPFTEHMKFLKGEMYEASGTNDVARGIVDVSVAESGIALALRMGPIIGEAEERDTTIEEVMNNLLHDLNEWFIVYEKNNALEAVQIVSTFGSKLPENEQAYFDNVVALTGGEVPLLSHGTARDMLRAKGWDIPEGEGANIIEEMNALQEVADAYASRLAEEGGTTEPGLDEEVDAEVVE